MVKKIPLKRLPKLTDTERHKRFLETARDVDASEDPKEFDRAFDKVISHHCPNKMDRVRKMS